MFSAFVVGPHGLATAGRTGQPSGALHNTYEAVSRYPRQAALLREHAEVMTHVGEAGKAREERAWAEALTEGIETDAAAGGARVRDGLPPLRYVDVVSEDGD